MAYISQEEDEDQQQGGAQQQQGAERVLTPQSGTVSAGQGGAAQAPGGASQNQKKAAGTGWTNLQRYVDANEGADERMGGQIRGTLDNSANDVKATQDSFRSDVETNVKTARRDDDGFIDRMKSDPTKVKKDDYQRQASDAWEGYYAANQGQGFGDAEKGVQKQAQRAGNLNDFSKRQGEMAEIYGKGESGSPVRYTGGEQRLDTFLIGAGQGGQKALSDINTEYGQGGNFAKGWESLVQKAQGDIETGQQARKDTAAATKAAQAEAVAARDARFKELESKLAGERTFAQQSTESARAAARSGANGFKDQLLRQAGIDPNSADAKAISGDELAAFIKMNGQRGLGDVVNDEDRLAYEALLDFEGQGVDAARFAKTGNQGGTYNVDLGGLTSLVGTKKTAREAAEAKQAAQSKAIADQNGRKGYVGQQLFPEEEREAAPAPQRQAEPDPLDALIDAQSKISMPGAPKKATDTLKSSVKKVKLR